MTFTDLRNKLSKVQIFCNNELDILTNKPFWIWDKSQHKGQYQLTGSKCCFNHVCGLPIKDGKEFPLFDYQKTMYDLLFTIDNTNTDKHLWIKKATGIGATEFMLRIMAWLCTSNNDYRNSQMVVVTGPNLDLAIKLMKRLKGIFEPKLQVYFNDKETSLILNGCDIQAYPSNHLDSFRALTSPKFILLDECDFFRESEQEDVRHVSERYIGKSDPHLVMVSTPNKPEGLFQKIEKEPENSCIYRRLSLGYQVGLDKIFTRGEIEKAKASPSFEREYNLKYLGKIGNVFTPQLIDIVVQNGEKYKNLPVNQYSLHSLGIDGGFGSSNTALVLCELLKDQHCIRVIYSREYEKGNPSFIADRVYELYQKYNNLWIWIDGSNRAFVNELKVRFGEDPNYEKAEDVSMDSNRVIPVNFNTDHKSMLSHLYNIVNKQYLAIPDLYDRLIISLRTATAKELTLDKDDSSYNDSFDAIRLACKGFQISSSYGLGY